MSDCMCVPKSDKKCQKVYLPFVHSTSYKIHYVIVIQNSLNLKGHQNPISCSKVTAILLKGLIWPICGASSGRVCACSLRSRLVIYCLGILFFVGKMEKIAKIILVPYVL